MKRFIIGGLPRSGTAWIANFLSMQKNMFCWHEAIQYGEVFETYGEAIDYPLFCSPSPEFCGDSTTAILPVFDEVEAQRFFIVRNPNECKDDYIRCLGDAARDNWDGIMANAKTWIDTHKPVRLLCSDIFSRNKEPAKRACNFLVEQITGSPMSRLSFELLYEKQVQIFGLDETFYDNKTIITKP